MTNQCKEEIFWWTRQLEANSDTEPRSGNRNRRISAGVGISLPSIDAKEGGGGQVECPRETASHKCIGVKSSRDCSFISCQEQKRNPCSLENGQHYCSIICEHNWGGGGQILNLDQNCQEHMEGRIDHSYCRAPTRSPKSNSRLGESEGNRDKFKQLETEQSSIQSDQTIGSNQTGFVCRETECSSMSLCQLEARSNGGGNRCTHDKMDGQASLCLPSILSHTEKSSQSRERRGS